MDFQEMTEQARWGAHTLFEHAPDAGVIVRTHSFYSTLWRCLPHENESDCIPACTSYLRVKLGTVGRIPCAAP